MYALLTFAAKFKLIALDRKIRVGAVSYLNTKPLLYGIENAPVFEEIELLKDYPARIADMLFKDEIDIGLVPVTIIPLLKEYYINTRFCIGCDGPVASVCLFSNVPVQEISTVLLDYQSRTSVSLVELLFKHYWYRNPEFKHAKTDFIQEIKGKTAAVVIGDRALQLRNISPYIYDLGEIWKLMTGLPFVFAAWISNKVLDPGWVNRFDAANEMGIKNIPIVVNQNKENLIDLNEYYTRYLSYSLDDYKKEGLELFLNMLNHPGGQIPA